MTTSTPERTSQHLSQARPRPRQHQQQQLQSNHEAKPLDPESTAPKAKRKSSNTSRQSPLTQTHRSNHNQNQESTQTQPPVFTSEDQATETHKAASQALSHRREASNLTRKALSIPDSTERQQLLKDALNHEIEAETFGKVAKWLQSGAFQGFALGSLPGVSLGTLVGVLVGGILGTVTGGLGAGVGALTGPRWKLGDFAAEGIRKVTGDWKIPGADYAVLEGMMRDVQDTEVPGERELEGMRDWGVKKAGLGNSDQGKGKEGRTWGGYAMSWVPGMGNNNEGENGEKGGEDGEARLKAERAKDENARRLRAAAEQPRPSPTSGTPVRDGVRKQPTEGGISTARNQNLASENTPAAMKTSPSQQSPSTPKRKPRKLEVRSGG